MTTPALDHLTAVSTTDVYKGDTLAATLTRVADGIEFVYQRGYLDSAGPPVATTLPLTDEPLHTHAGAIPPFFAGLLPEGRRLSGLRRAVKTSADDELSLLLAVGHDTVGDVRVVAEGEQPSPIEPTVQVSRDWSEIRFSDVLAESGVIDRVGIPGVQDKVSARMISVPIRRAGERYLLKVDPPEFPHVVENEAYFLDEADRVGINAAQATVVRDGDGRAGLLVRRFDRVPQPSGTATSLACEDACQVLGRWPADKYNVSAEVAVSALADRCAARPVAVASLYRQLCFAWLTGNGDVHAKNLSILATVDGEWRVSPAYDLPSTIPYGDKSMALPMLGRRTGISRRHLIGFAERVGLRERPAATILDEALDGLGELETALRDGALPFAEHTTIDLVKDLRYRRRVALG